MKWCKTLSNSTKHLPKVLQNTMIDYKKWKQLTRKNSDIIFDDMLQQKLIKECCLVDRIFKKIYSNMSFFTCCTQKYTNKEIILYSELNRTTLYKICKRINKNSMIPKLNALTWYNAIRKSHKFQFLGGQKLSALQLQIDKLCPICFEKSDKIAISICGHWMCISCLKNYYNITHHGTIYNTIAAQNLNEKNSKKCHICRYTNPYSKILII